MHQSVLLSGCREILKKTRKHRHMKDVIHRVQSTELRQCIPCSWRPIMYWFLNACNHRLKVSAEHVLVGGPETKWIFMCVMSRVNPTGLRSNSEQTLHFYTRTSTHTHTHAISCVAPVYHASSVLQYSWEILKVTNEQDEFSSLLPLWFLLLLISSNLKSSGKTLKQLE